MDSPRTNLVVLDSRFELLEAAPDHGGASVWKARDRRFRQRNKLVRWLRPLPAGETAFPSQLVDAVRALQSTRQGALLDVVQFGVHEGRPYLVYEWFDGTSLEHQLTTDPALRSGVPLAALRSIIEQVCDALDAAHRARVPLVHGGLDLSNVLVKDVMGQQPQARLLDLAIASWEAPSSVPCVPIDDVRAVGALLHRLFSTSSVQEAWREDTPSEVVSWIERCLGDDVAEQVPSVRALLGGLRTAWSSAPFKIVPKGEQKVVVPPSVAPTNAPSSPTTSGSGPESIDQSLTLLNPPIIVRPPSVSTSTEVARVAGAPNPWSTAVLQREVRFEGASNVVPTKQEAPPSETVPNPWSTAVLQRECPNPIPKQIGLAPTLELRDAPGTPEDALEGAVTSVLYGQVPRGGDTLPLSSNIAPQDLSNLPGLNQPSGTMVYSVSAVARRSERDAPQDHSSMTKGRIVGFAFVLVAVACMAFWMASR